MREVNSLTCLSEIEFILSLFQIAFLKTGEYKTKLCHYLQSIQTVTDGLMFECFNCVKLRDLTLTDNLFFCDFTCLNCDSCPLITAV